MAEYLIQDTTLKGIADAVREKTGGTDLIPVTEIETQIKGITGIAKALIERTATEITANDMKGVTKIGSGAFYNFESLVSISLPLSVTSIEAEAFANCVNLLSIYYDGTKAEWKEITKGANWHDNTGEFVIYCTDGEIVIEWVFTYTLNSNNASYTISGFSNEGRGNVVIPDTYEGLPVTIIGTGFLASNSVVENVTFPDTITSIGLATLAGCINLKTVTFGSGVSGFGKSALAECNSLSKITIKATDPPYLDSGALTNLPALQEIVVPKGRASAYKSATTWSNYGEIIVEAS